MGNTLAAARAEVEQAEEKEKQKSLQALDFMEKMLKAKMDSFSDTLKHPPDDSHLVNLGTIVDQVVDYTINIQKDKGKAVEAVGLAVDKFFDVDVLGGFKAIIQGSVDAFISDTTVGEKYHQEYHLVIDNNALVRVDSMLYKYNFETNGIVHMVDNAFCYMFYKSVIPLKEVKQDVVIYSVTNYVKRGLKEAKIDAADRNKYVLEYIQSLKSLYKALE
ncbi:7727_t:CDS:2 [Acaulospora morrowiae]|uniref:7727_t:CDS:1 n=1 Tax=Acaulospora morrowiae TaxID=94023 RepID=A0A9N9NB00_9GLOM|nr:7727_t:CDS:2 [Acaulospora morrowiae]